MKWRHSKTVKITDNTILNICGNPMRSTHIWWLKIINKQRLSYMRNSLISRQHIFYWYFEIFTQFYRSWLLTGTFLWNCGFTVWDLTEVRFWRVNWLLAADLSPFLMYGLLLFFLPLPRICSHVPIKRGGWWGAHVPPWDGILVVLLPNLGVPALTIYFFIQFNS